MPKKNQKPGNGLLRKAAGLSLFQVSLFVLLVAGVGITVRYASQAAVAPGTIRFVSWNLGADNARNEGQEIVDIMRYGDIMGTQELSSSAEQETVKKYATCTSCLYAANWTTHSYAGSNPNKNLILWRKANFKLINSGYVDVSPTITVNDAVGDTIPVKFIAWVKLQDIATGKQFYTINTHLVNGVEKNGKPRTDVSSKRLANYNYHMDKMVELVTTLKADNVPIFVTGDFNANYRYDRTIKNAMFPYARMGSVGAKSSYQILNLAGISSSTPSRLIDYVFAVTRTDVAVTSQKFSSSTHGSDHYALYATALLK